MKVRKQQVRKQRFHHRVRMTTDLYKVWLAASPHYRAKKVQALQIRLREEEAELKRLDDLGDMHRKEARNLALANSCSRMAEHTALRINALRIALKENALSEEEQDAIEDRLLLDRLGLKD